MNLPEYSIPLPRLDYEVFVFRDSDLKEFHLQSKGNLHTMRIIFQTLRESNDDTNIRKTSELNFLLSLVFQSDSFAI